MKRLLISALLPLSLFGSNSALYETSLYTGTLFLFLLMLGIIIIQYRKLSQEREILKEKSAKIDWLRQIRAENETKHLNELKEKEKEILTLTHRVETLELKLKEGTKNQVVEKIEALQKRRESVQRRLDREA